MCLFRLWAINFILFLYENFECQRNRLVTFRISKTNSILMSTVIYSTYTQNMHSLLSCRLKLNFTALYFYWLLYLDLREHWGKNQTRDIGYLLLPSALTRFPVGVKFSRISFFITYPSTVTCMIVNISLRILALGNTN